MEKRNWLTTPKPHSLVLIWLPCWLLILLGGWFSPRSVRAQQPNDIPYLIEDFNDKQAQDWNIDPGCWFESWEGNPLLFCQQHNSVTYPSGSWGDRPFTLKFKFTRLTEGMHINILTRDNPPGSDRYAIALGADYGNPNNPQLHVNLFKQIHDPPPPGEIVYGGSFDYAEYVWYQVTINYSYGRITVIVNPLGSDGYAKPGEPAVVNLLLDYQDPNPLAPGGISFESINQNSIFIDDVEVWGPAPAPGQPAQPRSPSQPQTPSQPQSPQPAFAYPECPPGEVLLLSEDFNSRQLPGWELETGWAVVDGRLQGEGHRWATYTRGNWENYRLRMIAGLREGRAGLHVNTRLGPGNRYFFGWHPNDFYFTKQMNEDYQDITREERAYDTSLWHSFEMSNIDSRVQVSIDGQTEVSWNDPRPLPPGTIGLETLDEGFFLVESLWVCGPRSELTPTPTRTTPRVSSVRTPTPTRFPARTPTPTEEAVVVIPPSQPPQDGRLPIDKIIIAVVILFGAGILYRWLRRRPPEQPKEPRKPPVIPGLPPVRLINVWLTAGAAGSGPPLKPTQSLKAGGIYTLHAQLQAAGKKEKAQKQSAAAGDIPLDVVVFSPQADFAREGPLPSLSLSPLSDSTILQRPLRPLRPGVHQVRVMVYYRNVLLQSAVLDLQVAPAEGRAPQLTPRRPAIIRLVDYVAVSRFSFLSELPRPVLNIFTNQSPNGDHWIGLYSSHPDASTRLQQGDLHTFSAAKLAEMARRLRERLAKVEGERMYRMDYSLPPDAQTMLDRERDLVDLAIEGFRLYDELFLSTPDGLSEDRLLELNKLLRERSIISIARCRGDMGALPWAALYSLPIDPDQPALVGLCPVFKEQVARTTWQAGVPEKVVDHLGQPQVCLSQANCPRNYGRLRQTVCPFGFWGFMHQVEQPLQQVQPAALGQLPLELEKPSFEQRSVLNLSPGQLIRLVFAAYPGLPELEEHQQEISGLSPENVLEMTFETRRQEVLKLLQEGGRHLYYFYCHGVMEDGVFKLLLGPLDDPGSISAAALDPFTIKWPDEPHPLFILNGCQTMALTPDLIHGFMGKLRRLGASGLVGSEVKVWTPLARSFGVQLLHGMLSGRSLGESALDVRLNLLRQGNPLGLVYSLYAPANLHLHTGDQCPRCRQGG